VSTTVTLEPQAPSLPEPSTAEQVIGVVPIAKLVPEGGSQAVGSAPQHTSVAVARP
jgi:hypothetical protein